MIKHLHMKSLTPKEIKAKLDNVHSTSAPVRLYTIEKMNLNVIVHPHVMHLVRDVQLRLLRQKSSIKSTILFWSTSENARACWGHGHITWHSDFNFANNWVWKSYRQDGCRVCCGCHKRPCDDFKTMFQRNPDEFLYRFIIVDETWIYFTSETKEQNNEFHRVNQLRRRRRS